MKIAIKETGSKYRVIIETDKTEMPKKELIEYAKKINGGKIGKIIVESEGEYCSCCGNPISKKHRPFCKANKFKQTKK